LTMGRHAGAGLVGPVGWAVAAGEHATCAVGLDGSLWCWGHNSFGERGDGGGGRDRPVRVARPEGT